MQSKATTVAQYLAELPPDRRAAIAAVRKVILANLDADYEEGMQYGMIGYGVPHRVFPPGYHCDPRQPLPFAGLASQKNHMALYLMAVGGDDGEGERFRAAWVKSGKKLEKGTSCIRFGKIEDLALDVIGDAIRRMPARAWVERYQKARAGYSPTPRTEIAARTAARKAAAARGRVSSAKKGRGKSAGVVAARRATPARRESR